MPSFKSSVTLYLLNNSQWFLCCRPEPDLIRSGFECSEVCFRAIFLPVLNVPPCRRSQLSPGFAHLGLTMLASTSASTAVKFLNWPFSWLILYGLAGTGDGADRTQSAIDCRVHVLTDSLQGVCHLLSDLLLRWPLLPGYATAAAADLECLQLTPFSMALISAPLPCQMDVCFVAQLEQE